MHPVATKALMIYGSMDGVRESAPIEGEFNLAPSPNVLSSVGPPIYPRYRLRSSGLQPRCETNIAARGRTLRVRQSWWHSVGPSGPAAIGTERKACFLRNRE